MDSQRIDKVQFEALLSQNQNAVERLVYYKIPHYEDARDILQEIYITAYCKLNTLQDIGNFKAWLVRIACNKCNDYYRKVLSVNHVSWEENFTSSLIKDRTGVNVKEAVSETLDQLNSKDRLVLQLFYLKQMSAKAIARRLSIPLGTVKSRLYSARNNFKQKYPYPPVKKGDINMSQCIFPDQLPVIKVVKSDLPVFEATCMEVPGWFIIPRPGEKVSWAIYDYPAKTRSETTSMTVTEKANIHGIECVEIICDEFASTKTTDKSTRRWIYARLTDTHVQNVADCHYHGDVKVMTTFLDNDFLANWSAGVDNCGIEIHLKPKGVLQLQVNDSILAKQPDTPDILGRYQVNIGSKTYDTLRILEVVSSGVIAERYIDKNGRTVLFRRYNKNDWCVGKNKWYTQPWSEALPSTERLMVNGELYVHWYDCISDYVL